MTKLDRQSVTAARQDIGIFAEVLIGQPLWPHQLDLARSDARIRSVCSGRQAGKTRVLAVVALHEAFRAPDRQVLLISAGDEAAKDLLSETSALASSPLLAGSIVDDELHQITLSNGSSIRSVPASEKQIRGKSIDCLIIDEAAFVSEEIWQAARFTVIARRDSRVVLASTPWGRQDKFFALAFRAGRRGENGYASFHWPSTASPLVDTELLELWRASTTEREYQREVEARWVDAAGSYFSEAELDAAVSDYELIPPADARRHRGVAGVDWGLRVDSSAVVVLAEAGPDDLPTLWPPHTFWLPWIAEGVGVDYDTFVGRVVDVARGYRLLRIASECNGVGAMPTTELERRLRFRFGRVVPVTTSATSKVDGFGRLKLLLSQGRLALPRHPRLLAQLAALEFEERDSGATRIAVPERAGHDDLAMALMLAVSEADVGSLPAGDLHLEVAGGNLPKPRQRALLKAQQDGPAVPVVRDGEPNPNDPRYMSFARARRHASYRPPGGDRLP